MNLSHLSFEGFRNLFSGSLEFSSGINIFFGNNAQGKTNLLDAVYLLAHLNSFRTSRVNDLISWEKENGIVEGKIVKKEKKYKLRVGLTSGRRRLFVDDMSVKEPGDFFVGFRVVVFSPDQLDIIKGSPSTRRKYIDRSSFRSFSNHLSDVRQYNKVLRNRNICLKEGRGDLVDLYGRQLADYGARVTQKRMRVISEMDSLLSQVYSKVVGVKKEVHVRYSSRWAGDSRQEENLIEREILEERLYKGLLKVSRMEKRRGHTLVGPHTDDIVFDIEGVSASRFGSQGQVRSLLVALKMTEYHMLLEKFGDPPVVLLDDLSSELDVYRRRCLLDYLNGIKGQAFVTTTDISFLDDDLERKEYTVHGGVIKEMN